MGGDDQGATVATRQSGHATTAVARNAINLFLGQAGTTVLAVVLSAALGRYLGAEDFGLYYLITTMSAFAYVFVEWGQPLYVMREVALDLSKSGELLGSALALRVALASLAATSAGLIAWALGYEARTRWLATLFILANLPVFLSLGYGMVFRARDRMGSDAAVSVFNKALMLCLTLPLLAFGAGIPGVLVAQALAGGAALGLAAAFYRRLRLPPLRASPQAVRALLAGGAPILVMSAATSVQPYLDAIVLSRLAPAIVVGWFGAARSVLGTLIAPAVILGAASFPTLTRASADPAALRIEVQRALRPLLWLGALAGTGTYLFAETAIGPSMAFGHSGPRRPYSRSSRPGCSCSSSTSCSGASSTRVAAAGASPSRRSRASSWGRLWTSSSFPSSRSDTETGASVSWSRSLSVSS